MPPLTPDNDRIRAENVSASEVGALMGYHPYATAGGIYDRLTLQVQRDASEAMSIGSYLESSILRFAEQRDGFRARLNQKTYAHRKVRLCATPDALLPPDELVEIKMSGRPDLWRELPEHVEWQARAQMACANRERVYVYALVGMKLLSFRVDRDRDKEAAMLERVQRFWTDNIVAHVRPEPAAPADVPVFSFDAAPPGEAA